MRSCWLISSLPPTRIKSYLLTTFWSPNQYYYRPNIETPRLCHRQSLLAAWWPLIMGPHTCCHQLHPHLVPVPNVLLSACFMSRAPLSLTTALSALDHNHSMEIIPLRPVLCWPGACVSVTVIMREGCEAVWGPLYPLGPPPVVTRPPCPPLCQIRPGQGPQWRLAALERVETLQMCGLWQLSSPASLASRVYAAGPNMGGVGISGLTTTVYNNTGSQWGNISRHFSVILCQVRPVTITIILIIITWARLSPCATLEKVWCHPSLEAQSESISPCHIPCHTRQLKHFEEFDMSQN